MARKLLLWGGVCAIAAAASSSAAAAPRAAACTTQGLAFSHVRVVSLRAQGVTCGRARSIAALVARDLARGRAVSVSGASGFSMSTESCTGCKTTTSVSIAYPHGSVMVNISGGSGSSAPAPVLPGGSPGPVV